MSTSKTRPWKILVMRRGKAKAENAEQYLHQRGYPNVKVVGVDNDKDSDDEVIRLLKSDTWNGVSIGKHRNFLMN